MLKNVHFDEIWECTLHFQTNYKAMKLKMENVCPVDNQIINDENLPSLILEMSKQEEKMMPEKHIIGRIVISTKVCAIFKTCSLKNSLQKSSTTYKFYTDKSLKVNITFVHFELITGEELY